jgi:hypothetical protein
MEVYTDGEVVFGLCLIILFTWMVASYWTRRRLGKLNNSSADNAPEKLMEPLQRENRELRALVERQEDRIRVLETIATDPARRTEREIEQLR